MAETTRKISIEEVQRHKTPESLWMIIFNSVYDVTAFLEEHPGGGDVLIENGGIDATVAFEDVGHSSDARELMKKYKIGDLIIDPAKCNSNFNVKEYIPHIILAFGVGITIGYAVKRFCFQK
ncbi:cytochrome b5-like [Arctopsyche grandis]|uniref:cytochrome b5-like n=1 Tax=Arctopsyche grandis TaxID=121162 RepID=UPI00406D8A7F